ALGRSRVGVENNPIPSGDHVDDIPAKGRNRMGRGRDGGYDAKRRVLLQGNSVVAAAAIRAEPFHTGDELDDFELLDLVIEPANLRFLQFDSPPLDSVGVSHRLYDFYDVRAGGDTFLSQLKKAGMRGRAGFAGVLEDAVLAGAPGMAIAAAAGFFSGRGGRRGNLAKAAEHFRNDVADESFVNG